MSDKDWPREYGIGLAHEFILMKVRVSHRCPIQTFDEVCEQTVRDGLMKLEGVEFVHAAVEYDHCTSSTCSESCDCNYCQIANESQA